LGPLESIDERVDAGGESLVAVVEPDVLADGDQGGEEVTGKRPEELVEPGSSRRVLDTLFVDGDAGAADLKSEDVVEDDEEGEAGFAGGNPALCSGRRTASATVRECGPRGSRVFSRPATPG
jgi:hypothetical protein